MSTGGGVRFESPIHYLKIKMYSRDKRDGMSFREISSSNLRTKY